MPRQITPAGSDPTAIGEVSAPPFALLPDPSLLFARRAQRLAQLAEGHQLGPYLRFVGDLGGSPAQASRTVCPSPEMPDLESRERARSFGMPPSTRNKFAVCDALRNARAPDFGNLGDQEAGSRGGSSGPSEPGRICAARYHDPQRSGRCDPHGDFGRTCLRRCGAAGSASSPVGRPDFKSGRGRETVLGGFDSHSLPPSS